MEPCREGVHEADACDGDGREPRAVNDRHARRKPAHATSAAPYGAPYVAGVADRESAQPADASASTVEPLMSLQEIKRSRDMESRKFVARES